MALLHPRGSRRADYDVLTHVDGMDYPLVNAEFGPENPPFLLETNMNQPRSARVELLIYW